MDDFEVCRCRVTYLARMDDKVFTGACRGLALGTWPEAKMTMIRNFYAAWNCIEPGCEAVVLDVDLIEVVQSHEA